MQLLNEQVKLIEQVFLDAEVFLPLVQVDRNEDMLRSCLRAVEACSRIPDVESSTGFRQLMERVVLVPPIAPKYKAVQDERAEAVGRGTRDL